jgi:ribulose-5-phosphate 4-epimerase/fuculose-1-phosphate aldolase
LVAYILGTKDPKVLRSNNKISGSSQSIGYLRRRIMHGQVVCGKTFDEVFERAMFFEMACRIIILTKGEYMTLSKTEIADLETSKIWFKASRP